MSRWGAVVAIAGIVAGLALIGRAIADGSARVALVVIVPVVTGSSAGFVAGVALVFLGLVALLFTAADVLPPDDPRPDRGSPGRVPPTERSETSSLSGVVLVGPVPFFFGSRRPGRATVWAFVAIGTALTVLAIAIFVIAL